MMPQGYPQPHPAMMQQQYMPPQMQTPTRGLSVQRQAGPPPAGGHYMPQQMMTPTPNPVVKRARPAPSMSGASGASAATIGVMESIEDEEDTSRGDVLDHLTPREISTQRYIQHHEWLEEVFNSVYPSGNIRPGSIGIETLGGPLKPLVEGVFNKDGTPQNGKSQNEACRTVMERARKMTEDIEAEMEGLRRKHAQELEDFQKHSIVLSAEKELRMVGFDEFMQSIGIHIPSPPVDRNAMVKDTRTMDEIIAEVETTLNVKVVERDLIHVWNPQPDIALLEEAAALEAAQNASNNNNNGGNEGADENKDKDNAMADVTAAETEANTGFLPSNAAPAAGVAQQSVSPAPIPSADQADTMMADADPVTSPPTIPSISAPTLAPPIPASVGTAGTPSFSPAPISPFAIPSPSLQHSRSVTPQIPTPFPATAELGRSETPKNQGSTPIPVLASAPIDEPPTVPDEDEIPEGFVGGDDDFDLGGDVADEMELLGANDSFADEFLS